MAERRGRGRKKEDKRKKIEPRFLRRKGCRFCKDKKNSVSYREAEFLGNFLSEKGRILPGRISGNCAKHQRMVCRAIKQARELALLPFVAE